LIINQINLVIALVSVLYSRGFSMNTSPDLYTYKKPALVRLSVPRVTSKVKVAPNKETKATGNEDQAGKTDQTVEDKGQENGTGNAAPS
jgi:hypothetical protein